MVFLELRPPGSKMTRRHKASSALAAAIGSGYSDLCGKGFPVRSSPGVLLPGRRRLMRDEDPSESDSEGEGEKILREPSPQSPSSFHLSGSAAAGSRKRFLCDRGDSVSESVGEGEGSSGSP